MLIILAMIPIKFPLQLNRYIYIYEGQSISNASYFCFPPLLFKKTQIQLHSLKTTTLPINLSLFNIISVHFHRFGPLFNKDMYSSPVKAVAGRSASLRFVSQTCLSFSFFTATNPLLHPHTHFSAFHVCEWAFHLLLSTQNAV